MVLEYLGPVSGTGLDEQEAHTFLENLNFSYNEAKQLASWRKQGCRSERGLSLPRSRTNTIVAAESPALASDQPEGKHSTPEKPHVAGSGVPEAEGSS